MVSLPARNRSRQHRTRLPSSKPKSRFLLCCWARWRDKHMAGWFLFSHSYWVHTVSIILSPRWGRGRCNLVGLWGPDPTYAALSLLWWMPPKTWSSWRCRCEDQAHVSWLLGMHRIADWRVNRVNIFIPFSFSLTQVGARNQLTVTNVTFTKENCIDW